MGYGSLREEIQLLEKSLTGDVEKDVAVQKKLARVKEQLRSMEKVRKFNPNHDKGDGRFTFRTGGVAEGPKNTNPYNLKGKPGADGRSWSAPKGKPKGMSQAQANKITDKKTGRGPNKFKSRLNYDFARQMGYKTQAEVDDHFQRVDAGLRARGDRGMPEFDHLYPVKKYNPNHEPAGSPQGGEFASGKIIVSGREAERHSIKATELSAKAGKSGTAADHGEAMNAHITAGAAYRLTSHPTIHGMHDASRKMRYHTQMADEHYASMKAAKGEPSILAEGGAPMERKTKIEQALQRSPTPGNSEGKSTLEQIRDVHVSRATRAKQTASDLKTVRAIHEGSLPNKTVDPSMGGSVEYTSFGGVKGHLHRDNQGKAIGWKPEATARASGVNRDAARRKKMKQRHRDLGYGRGMPD